MGENDNNNNNNTETENGDSSMSILEHLEELRNRLIKIFIAAAFGFAACYWKADEIFTVLMKPLTDVLPQDSNLIFTGLTEGFFTQLKVGLIAGAFLVSPYILYQIWAFVSPALYKKERTILIPVAFFSAVFFVGGACFGYFIVFPYGFKFLVNVFESDIIQPLPSVKEYLSLAVKMLIAFGVVFELPLVVLVLSRFGIVTHKTMRKYQKFAILGIFIVGAMLTPPDVFTQLMMAGPLILLYEMSIWVAYFFGKKKELIEEPEETSDEED